MIRPQIVVDPVMPIGGWSLVMSGAHYTNIEVK